MSAPDRRCKKSRQINAPWVQRRNHRGGSNKEVKKKSPRCISVDEYVDVVESAKNEFRPAFQELMRDIHSPARGWDTLLTLDTSRLLRRCYVSLVFKHDAKKNGVQILYAKMSSLILLQAPISSTMTRVGSISSTIHLHELWDEETGVLTRLLRWATHSPTVIRPMPAISR